MCLYCEKCFGTVEGCQQHMKDQRHCRLPVANEDLYFDEYGEYYDFSTEESSTKVKLLFFFLVVVNMHVYFLLAPLTQLFFFFFFFFLVVFIRVK